ncbi:MAG: dipicolinate synthase subunit DpsA [Clostridia bacterium]|nr:dipicolinate synthase subunit DpsA [Clostridia bacterium]
MQSRLEGVRVAVLGGDGRQVLLVAELGKLGARVKVIGLSGIQENSRVTIHSSLEETVRDAQVVLLPMPGVNDEGRIFAPQINIPLHLTAGVVEKIPPGAPILVGVAKRYLRELLAEKQRKLVEVAELDNVAILNSIPSAEGAIQMAMEAVPITIHNSNSFVLGYGRTGITLARMLKGIGAKVWVAARKPGDLARIEEQGYRPVPFPELGGYIQQADLIFNTVPAMVLDKNLLTKVSREAYILDLASTPGGTDFLAASNLGIKAVLAPGLPGKVAPKTAGQILIQVIPDLVCKLLALE